MSKKGHLWGDLYSTHYMNVYNFFLKRLGSKQDASDAAQETFLRVVRNEKSDNLDSPAGYLWRTARNLFMEIIRRDKLRENKMVPQGEDMEKHISPLPNPEENITSKEETKFLVDLVESLPPRCRQVFIMHRFQGFSHKEISSQLGISRKTVENHMANALVFLRKNLF
ncbi:MAG: hypothetical protein CSA42_00205 [Gammaproteobacteria bacterium]|nr:MAG: hypothetical protein CSA42_00205 [Gammaproteobacteria bacterium]